MLFRSGVGKGRNLFSPKSATRPTSDRAKEALFSTLESEFGSLNDLYLLDLFCGSGAIGVEALSRGAAVVHAVDKEEDATQIARQNFALLEGYPGIGSASVFTMAAHRYLESLSNITFDIIFIDPPYETKNENVEKILGEIAARQLMKSGGIVAVERETRQSPFTWPMGFEPLKEREYGIATIYYAVANDEEKSRQ
mgnify:FL=1